MNIVKALCFFTVLGACYVHGRRIGALFSLLNLVLSVVAEWPEPKFFLSSSFQS